MAVRRRLRIRTARPRGRREPRPAEGRGPAAWARSSRVWVVSVVGGAVAALLTTVITGLPGQVLDLPAMEDSVRSGPDFSVTVDVVRLDDEGRSAVTRDEFTPSAAQARLMARPGSAATADFARLLRSAGAVNLDAVTLRLTLTGRRNQRIDVQDITARIVARTEPLSGSLLCLPPQGGAATMTMLYDMDRPFPVAHDVRFGDDTRTDGAGDAAQGLGPPFFAQRTITLHDDEQQVLLIRAVTAQHYVAFRLGVDYLLGGRKKEAVIDDHGAPFQVSALLPAKAGQRPAYRSVFTMRSDFSVGRATPAVAAGAGGRRDGLC